MYQSITRHTFRSRLHTVPQRVYNTIKKVHKATMEEHDSHSQVVK